MAQVFAHLGGGLVELRWEFAAVTTPRAQINHKDVVVNAHGCNMGVREIPVRHSTKLKTADRVYHGWSASISKLMADFTPKKQNPQKVHWQNQNRSINRPFFPIPFQKKKSTGVDNKSNDDLAHCHYDSWEILNKTEPLLMLSINAFFYHDNPHHPTARTDTLAHLGTAVQKHLVKTGKLFACVWGFSLSNLQTDNVFLFVLLSQAELTSNGAGDIWATQKNVHFTNIFWLQILKYDVSLVLCDSKLNIAGLWTK